MKKWINIIFIFLFVNCLKTSSQINVVLNPGFEEYIGPCKFADFNYNCSGSLILSWYDPTESASFWFNQCNNFTSPDAGVPSNYFGYQYPHSGLSYADIFAVEANERGYLTGQFSQKLSAGKKYCINFYVSLEDSNFYALSALGAFISDTAPCIANYFGIINCIPQIENPLNNLLTNKIDWVSISGEMVANGGEQYITLGDFYSDNLSHFTYVGGGGMNFDTSNVVPEPGYFLDDVSVRLITFANAFNNKKDTQICNGGNILIGGDTAVTGVSYQWLPTTGLQNPNAAQTMASPIVNTTYTLFVKNDSMQNCLCPDSVSIDSVTVHVITINGFACCDTFIAPGQSVQLEASGGISYAWSPTISGCDTCPFIIVEPAQTSVYTVTISDSGCSVNRTVTIEVGCGQVFIPTAFSPNNSHNNTLYVRGNCISTMDFIVFDRWGNKVFESQNVNYGWDGTFRGKPMNTGTYMYNLTATLQDGTSVERKGNVALVR